MKDIILCEDCDDEAQYVCLCLHYETFWCELHLREHLNGSNKSHVFDSIVFEPTEWTKDGIIKFLLKEKLKKETVRKIALTQNICDPSFKIRLNELNFDLEEISNLIINISQISAKNKDSSLYSLSLHPESDTENKEDILLNSSDSNFMWLRILNHLRNQKLNLLNKTSNDMETEKEFRKNCLFYENNASNWLLRQSYKEYVKIYRKLACILNIQVDKDKVFLYIYETESESERERGECEGLQHGLKIDPKFIIQLPNFEWLVYLKCKNQDDSEWDFAWIINRNYRIRNLPYGGPDNSLIAIYFNRSIYCFRKSQYTNSTKFHFSRFNLDENRWTDLTPIDSFKSKNDYPWSKMIIFKGNILISDYYNRHLLLYSIDIDSFSIIPYKFSKRSTKLLINVEERLYLIEPGGWIYESEIGNEYIWKEIGESTIYGGYSAEYCQYNKGGIYISTFDDNLRTYFKFDLSKKEIIEIGCYGNKLAVKKLGCKLNAIKWYDHKAFNLDIDYISSECSPHRIVNDFEDIVKINKKLNQDPKDGLQYIKKGDIFYDLGLNIEAIKCYDIAIQLKPIFNEESFFNAKAYDKKAEILEILGRNNEALQCYAEAIKLNPYNKKINYKKAGELRDSHMKYEAIEIYNEINKFESIPENACFKTGVIFHDLGKNIEALECYNEAIKLNPHNLKYFSYRASIFNDLGQEEEAIDDFNRAYELLINDDKDLFYWDLLIKEEDCLELIKILTDLLVSAMKVKEEFKKIKEECWKNWEIINEIERKMLIAKEQRSKILKRAVESLDRKKPSIEEIKEIKKEVFWNKQATIDIFVRFARIRGITKSIIDK